MVLNTSISSSESPITSIHNNNIEPPIPSPLEQVAQEIILEPQEYNQDPSNNNDIQESITEPNINPIIEHHNLTIETETQPILIQDDIAIVDTETTLLNNKRIKTSNNNKQKCRTPLEGFLRTGKLTKQSEIRKQSLTVEGSGPAFQLDPEIAAIRKRKREALEAARTAAFRASMQQDQQDTMDTNEISTNIANISTIISPKPLTSNTSLSSVSPIIIPKDPYHMLQCPLYLKRRLTTCRMPAPNNARNGNILCLWIPDPTLQKHETIDAINQYTHTISLHGNLSITFIQYLAEKLNLPYIIMVTLPKSVDITSIQVCYDECSMLPLDVLAISTDNEETIANSLLNILRNGFSTPNHNTNESITSIIHGFVIDESSHPSHLAILDDILYRTNPSYIQTNKENIAVNIPIWSLSTTSLVPFRQLRIAIEELLRSTNENTPTITTAVTSLPSTILSLYLQLIDTYSSSLLTLCNQLLPYNMNIQTWNTILCTLLIRITKSDVLVPSTNSMNPPITNSVNDNYRKIWEAITFPMDTQSCLYPFKQHSTTPSTVSMNSIPVQFKHIWTTIGASFDISAQPASSINIMNILTLFAFIIRDIKLMSLYRNYSFARTQAIQEIVDSNTQHSNIFTPVDNVSNSPSRTKILNNLRYPSLPSYNWCNLFDMAFTDSDIDNLFTLPEMNSSSKEIVIPTIKDICSGTTTNIVWNILHRIFTSSETPKFDDIVCSEIDKQMLQNIQFILSIPFKEYILFPYYIQCIYIWYTKIWESFTQASIIQSGDNNTSFTLPTTPLAKEKIIFQFIIELVCYHDDGKNSTNTENNNEHFNYHTFIPLHTIQLPMYELVWLITTTISTFSKTLQHITS